MLAYSLARVERGAAAPVPAASPIADLTRTPDLPTRAPAVPRPDARFVIAEVMPGAEVAVHARPFGPVLRRLSARTEFGSARRLSVVRSLRGRWLAVTTPELGNGRLGWIDAADRSVRFARTPVALDVDLSLRQLTVRVGDRVARRVRIGVGRPGSPTPTGRFAITDKLSGPEFGSYYGCCILALSGRQPNLPPGWQGGDRLAIHGTPNPAGIGDAVSAGCLHASAADLRALMKTVDVGTPVRIHP